MDIFAFKPARRYLCSVSIGFSSLSLIYFPLLARDRSHSRACLSLEWVFAALDAISNTRFGLQRLL